jgi:hypothetical protein
MLRIALGSILTDKLRRSTAKLKQQRIAMILGRADGFQGLPFPTAEDHPSYFLPLSLMLKAIDY